MMKPSLTQIGLVATLLAAPAKALAADFATNVVTSVAADLLIGGGYVATPLGIALELGNGKLTPADRISALYAGAKVTADFSNPHLGDYFIEVGTFNGSSDGSFRDLSAVFGTTDKGQPIVGTSSYTLKESFLQGYIGRRLARDQHSYDAIPDWQILARVGFTYIDAGLKSIYFSPTEFQTSGKHDQDSQEWLANFGLRADINVWTATRRIFKGVGLPIPSQSRVVLDGEVSAGVRSSRVFESSDSSEGGYLEGFQTQDIATYGGVGRITLLNSFEVTTAWWLVINVGVQSRYMWIQWDDVPSSFLQKTANVRGNELLWGPYFQIGIQHLW